MREEITCVVFGRWFRKRVGVSIWATADKMSEGVDESDGGMLAEAWQAVSADGAAPSEGDDTVRAADGHLWSRLQPAVAPPRSRDDDVDGLQREAREFIETMESGRIWPRADVADLFRRMVGVIEAGLVGRPEREEEEEEDSPSECDDPWDDLFDRRLKRRVEERVAALSRDANEVAATVAVAQRSTAGRELAVEASEGESQTCDMCGFAPDGQVEPHHCGMEQRVDD